MKPGNEFLALGGVLPLFFRLAVEQRQNMISGLEGQIDKLFGYRQVTASHQIEDGFDLVGECGNGGKAEHGTGAFDGVHGPKYLADGLVVIRLFFKFQKRVFELTEQFVGFFFKGVLRGILHGHPLLAR